MRARDGDKDRPDNMVYSLQPFYLHDQFGGDFSKFFSINKTTGEIFMLKVNQLILPLGSKSELFDSMQSLDWRERSQWKFTALAQDEGGIGLVGYTYILVNLSRPPHFINRPLPMQVRTAALLVSCQL